MKKGVPSIDLTGQKFNRLTVVEFYEVKKETSFWKCICDCGNPVVVRSYNLRSGITKSCGCFRYEKARKQMTVHGKTRTKVYRAWCGMINRCDETDPKYNFRYAFRGITVCDRWRNSFVNFYNDMGDPPSQNHSLDRINNNGNYEPGNCRWATPKEQNLNTRRNVYIEFNGKRQTQEEWAQELNINVTTIWRRLGKGLSVEDVFYNGKFDRWSNNKRDIKASNLVEEIK